MEKVNMLAKPHFEGNVLSISVLNIGEFNKLLKKTKALEDELHKTIQQLSAFELKIVFDDAYIGSTDSASSSINDMEIK